MSDSLGSHGLQYARLPCPSLSAGICSNSRPLGQWCYPTILSSVAPFFYLQFFPASGSFPMNWLFISDGQSIGESWKWKDSGRQIPESQQELPRLKEPIFWSHLFRHHYSDNNQMRPSSRIFSKLTHTHKPSGSAIPKKPLVAVESPKGLPWGCHKY